MTEIQKLAFKNIYLANINLSRNAISKVENGAFENCANITVLDLSFNKISAIPKKAFDETTYATVLNLAYNNLTEMTQVCKRISTTNNIFQQIFLNTRFLYTT